MQKPYLGYSEQDLITSPYAKFYRPQLDPLQEPIRQALLTGNQAEALFHTVSDAPKMAQPGYGAVETGFCRGRDFSISVFCLTPMPDVTPAMWDWWFGWHGCEAQRYKLWHPQAHVSAQWADGGHQESYVGRTSLITEYLGSSLMKGAIKFVRPKILGFDEDALREQGEVIVCARIGIPNTPINGGWLLHQIRPVPGGSEMRSRMWLGGAHSSLGDTPNSLLRSLMWLLRPVTRLLLPDPADLLVHNAQEMAHLASVLPALYGEYGPQPEQATTP